MARGRRRATGKMVNDDPSPRLAHFAASPKPAKKGDYGPMADPGEVPPENSGWWHFSLAAGRGREESVRDDTRQWFAERRGMIQICRNYPDHPRWQPRTSNGSNPVANYGIISEIHVLARITKGLPAVPSWYLEDMTVKQVRSEFGTRFLRIARDASVKHLPEALDALAVKDPKSFVKIMMELGLPATSEVEHNHTVHVADGDKELLETTRDLLAKVRDEKRRREMAIDVTAKVISGSIEDRALHVQELKEVRPLDFVPREDPRQTLRDVAVDMREAVNAKPDRTDYFTDED